MNPLSFRETLPPDDARKIDRICSSFEAAWNAGQRPRVENFLGDTPELIPILLRELLLLEIEYRVQAGDPPNLHEYVRRFPAHRDCLRLIFEQYRLDVPENLPPLPLGEGLEVREPRPTPQTLPVQPGNNTQHATPETISFPLPSTPQEDQSLPAVPGYEILEVLGEGGMGVVYKARHLKLKRVVALKMLLTGPHARKDDLDRFRTEAEAVARLQHPNIVQIYEIGEYRSTPAGPPMPYFALEFVGGGSLAKFLAGTLQPPMLAAQCIETLARAIHAAHQAGIIHRDLKPANILLQVSGVRRQGSASTRAASADSQALTPVS